MRYLPLISYMMLLTGCATLYGDLKKTKADTGCLQKFKPAFTSVLYNTQIDVAGRHLSGLLIIKKMPDSSTRVAFSNEMGFTFFDFEFSNQGDFKAYKVIEQINKKPVITMLRKDFELILMQQTETAPAYSMLQDELLYTAFPQTRGVYYYITDAGCNKLLKMERASKRKVVMEAIMQHIENGVPDTIGISHKNFRCDIGLKKVTRQ